MNNILSIGCPKYSIYAALYKSCYANDSWTCFFYGELVSQKCYYHYVPEFLFYGVGGNYLVRGWLFIIVRSLD